MSVSRRGLFAGLAAAAGALASGSAKAAGVHGYEGYAGRYGLLYDSTLCTGCRSCERACAEENDLPAPPAELKEPERLRRTTDEQFTVVNRYETSAGVAYRKHQCMHCNEPCCATVCLVHAFTKTPEGPVLYDPDVCIGCRYCVTACPYYALAYEYDDSVTPKVVRCTMCYPRVKDGKATACASTCPTGAIQFGRREELLEVARDRIRKSPDGYLHHIFGEHELGGTSWLVLAKVPLGELGLPEHLTTESLAAIGTSYLGVVPMIVAIYPGLLAALYAFTKRKDELSREELDQAVAKAIADANESQKLALQEASTKAAKDKDRAVSQAVKKALDEAQKKSKEPSP